jgi:esterase
VVEFAAANGLDRVHLLGHSLGGKVAMHLAITRPDLVDHLVVADMSPLQARSGHEDIIAALQSVDVAGLESRDEADALLAKRISSEPVRQFLLKNLKRGDNGRYEWKMNLTAIVQNYSKIGEAVADGVFEGPTLFLRGARSRYIEPEDEVAISRMFPNASIVDIEAGHWLHAERPQEFADAVVRFLPVRQTARAGSHTSA